MMTAASPKSRSRPLRRWIRRVFLLWASISVAWLANSVRTQGVSDEVLRSSRGVDVVEGPTALEFRPTGPDTRAAALVFICGSGVHPHAYAPLLRPIAEAGYLVLIVRLPYRFAPLASHKAAVVDRVRSLVAAHRDVSRWVIAGRSLGGALAARVAHSTRGLPAAFVLIGTTHPKDDDLSKLDAPFTKVFATNDGIAPVDRVMATRTLLPEHTTWVE
jgi:dienelactone hydrolase